MFEMSNWSVTWTFVFVCIKPPVKLIEPSTVKSPLMCTFSSPSFAPPGCKNISLLDAVVIVTSFVAFTLRSVNVPTLVIVVCAGLVTVAAEPVTLPSISAVTVKPVNVPTLVIAVCAALVTVAAEPVTLPTISAVTVKPVNVPTLVIAVCAGLVTVAAEPVTLPTIAAVTVKPVYDLTLVLAI